MADLPPSIEHRCLGCCYTKLGRSSRYSTMHIYAWQIHHPPSQSSIDALNTATPNLADLADIAQYTYMHGRLTPRSIEHTCLESTPNLPQRTSTYERPSTLDGNYPVTPLTSLCVFSPVSLLVCLQEKIWLACICLLKNTTHITMLSVHLSMDYCSYPIVLSQHLQL